jgi:hypothetical protein
VVPTYAILPLIFQVIHLSEAKLTPLRFKLRLRFRYDTTRDSRVTGVLLKNLSLPLIWKGGWRKHWPFRRAR